ncbi:MAG TPA: YdeI/OmpD-associated family protein [Anaerolineae bacterium]|nr:YdeI/OmpD-associated family protein [Anaerolineae bacterium]
MTSTPKAATELPIKLFKTQKAWTTWLNKNHAKSAGVWVQIAKKTSDLKSVSYAEAVEVALCYGWIDGQGKGLDESAYLQKFTPRGPRSIWSKINRTKAMELIKSGRMQPAGLAAIDRAKQNGQWEAAYDSHRTATVPDDLQAALNRNPKAKAFFTTLDSTNRYAILWRVQTAKKAETRARRIEQFVTMLENHEKLHP